MHSATRTFACATLLALTLLSPAFADTYTYTKMLDFNASDRPTASDGLTLDSSGNLYGTTQIGGTSNLGTVFKLSSNGVYSDLFDFNGTNGANPFGITLDSNGNLYGTTQAGGANNKGTLFELAITPEPGIWALFASISVSASVVLRRRKSRRA